MSKGRFRNSFSYGKAAKLNANTVRKYVLELEERQLIRIEPTSVTTKGGRKRSGAPHCYIRPIQKAANRYNE